MGNVIGTERELHVDDRGEARQRFSTLFVLAQLRTVVNIAKASPRLRAHARFGASP